MEKMKVTFWRNFVYITTAVLAVAAMVGICLCNNIKPTHATGETYDAEIFLSGTDDQMYDEWTSYKGAVHATLLNDWVSTRSLRLWDDGSTLDLNGHTLTFAAGCHLDVFENSDSEITDSSASKSGRILAANDGVAVLFTQNSSIKRIFTLSGGNISKLEAKADAGCPPKYVVFVMTGGRVDQLVVSGNGATLDMTGGRISSITDNSSNGLTVTTGENIYPIKDVDNIIGYEEHTEHIYGEWKVDVEPTTETEGSKHKVCSVCGDTVTATIAKLPPVDPEPEAPAVKDNDDKVNVGAIVGGAVGGAVTVGALAGGAMMVTLRRRKIKK